MYVGTENRGATVLDAVDVASLVTAAVAAGTSALAWRRRASGLSAPLSLILGAGAVWSLASVLAEHLPWDLARRAAEYAILPAVGLLVASALWYAFALAGRTELLTRRLAVALAVEPVLLVVAALVDPWAHVLLRWHPDATGRLIQGTAAGFWVHTAYSYALLLVTAVVLARAVVAAVPGHRWAPAAVLGSMAFPVAGNIVSLTMADGGSDITPVLFLVTAAVWLWIEVRRQGVRQVPITTRDVVSAIGDAVLVVDAAGTVVDANPAAEQLLGGRAAEITDGRIVGERWSDFLEPGLVARLVEAGQATVRLPGLVLDVRATQLVGAGGAHRGSVVVARDVSELDRLRAELADQALRDPLTGLHNRRHLQEVLDGAVAHARSSGEPLTAVMVDLDHFKTINDRFGHPAGDAVLVAVAELLRGAVRGDDVVCRVGGEEFALLLRGLAPADAAARVEALRQRCADLEVAEAPGARITVSAGVAAFDPRPRAGAWAADGVPTPHEPATAEVHRDLLAAADAALYRAKRTGRDVVVVA